MKKKLTFIVIIVILFGLISACMGGGDGDCGMCGGSGYYDRKTCPACSGSGSSGYDPYEEMYGD